MIVKVNEGEFLYNALSYGINGEIVTTPIVVKEDEPFFNFAKRLFFTRRKEVEDVL